MQYENVTSWLKSPTFVVLTFAEIEQLIGEPLPDSARKHRPWWGNKDIDQARQCQAWMSVGWHVEKVDLAAQTVRFKKS